MGVEEHQDPPDFKEDDAEKNGLICFLDSTRECGPDCMGYIHPDEKVENSPLLNRQQQNCVLLISVERLGRYVGAGVSMLRKDKADQARQPMSPPNPLGKKT